MQEVPLPKKAIPMIKLSLPLPPKDLNAHSSNHYWKRRKATRQCRSDAATLALQHRRKGFQKGVISYKFWFPDNRPRDLANYIQMCKAYVDGIVDAGIIPDDRWQVLSFGQVSADIDREDPRVEIIIDGLPLIVAGE